MTYLGQLIFNDGVEAGMAKGIGILIRACQKINFSRDNVRDLIRDEFSLKETDVEGYMEQFWRANEVSAD